VDLKNHLITVLTLFQGHYPTLKSGSAILAWAHSWVTLPNKWEFWDMEIWFLMNKCMNIVSEKIKPAIQLVE